MDEEEEKEDDEEEEKEDGEEEDGEEEEEVERVRGRIAQLDGADSDISTTEYESEDEVDSAPEPVVLVPASVQPAPGQPLALEVDLTGGRQLPASILLVMVTNSQVAVFFSVFSLFHFAVIKSNPEIPLCPE